MSSPERNAFYTMIAARIKLERIDVTYMRSPRGQRLKPRAEWFAAKIAYTDALRDLARIMKEIDLGQDSEAVCADGADLVDVQP